MKYLILIITLFPIICSSQESKGIGKTVYSIFTGKVVSITEIQLKEGTFAEVKVDVDSIIQLDTSTNEMPGYDYYLNKKRIEKHNNKKPLIVTMLVEPELCHLQVCMRYMIYTSCCHVDSYYYIPEKTKLLKN